MSKLILSLLGVITLIGAPLAAQEGPLRVLRHAPSDTASPGNIVTVTFDRPVAGRLDATIDPRRIFHIEPAPAGRVAWRDPITIRFAPDEPLPPGSTFVVTIDTVLTAMDGSRLEAPYRFSFRVPGPRLLERSFAGDYSGHPDQLPVDGKLELLYSAPVNLAALGRALRVELTSCDSVATQVTIAMRPVRQRTLTKTDPYPFHSAGGWDRDTVGDRFRRVVELEPAKPLPTGCRGQLVLPNTADDAKFGAEERFAIRTAPPFRLVQFDCRGYFRCSLNNLTLAFTAPVKGGDVLRYVHLDPRLPFEIDDSTAQTNSFAIKVHLSPHARYDVRVDTILRDIYGRKLEPPYHAEISTGDYAPSIGYPRGFLAMPRSDLTIPLRHVNVREVRIISFAIPDSQRARILALAPQLVRLEFDRQSRTRPETTIVTLPGAYNVERTTQLALPPAIVGHRLVAFRMEPARVIRAPGADSVHGPIMISAPRYSPWGENPYAILQITNLAAHAKIAAGQGMVLINGIDDGKPRTGVTVRQLDDSGRVIAVGKTGDDGVAVFRVPERAPSTLAPISNVWPPRVGIVEAELLDDRAILPLTRRAIGYDAINPLQPGELGARPGAAPAAAATLFADRGIYRPGEMLYLTAIVRDGPLGALELPPARDSVRSTLTYSPLSWRSDEDVVVHDTVLKLNEFGTMTDSFHLRGGLALGSYRAEMRVRRNGAWQVAATESIRLAEYRAPEFLVDLAADSGIHRGSDTLRARVSGKYLFGAPMGRAAIDWSATLREAKPWEVKIPGAEGWMVGVWDWLTPETEDAPHTLGGRDSLDGAGRRELSVPLSSLHPSRPGHVTINVAVTDVNRQVVTATTEAAVHATDLYVLARNRSTAWYGITGERQAIELRTVRPDGSPVTGVPVAVTVVRRRWKPWSPRGYSGHWVDDSVRTDTVRSADAPATYSFVPGDGGLYDFRFAAADGRGGVARTTLGIYVLGADYRWLTTNPFQLHLVAGNGELEVGKTAQVAFDSPFDEADAWITIERESVIEQRHVAAHHGSNLLNLAITDRYAPNVFVGVVLVKSGRAAAQRPDSAAQTIRVGYTELHVKTTTKQLTVSVSPAQAEWRPGDTASIRIQVRDVAGRGVRGGVTLWAVDEGVLALTGYTTPDVLARMYAPRGLGVGIWSTLPTILTSDPGLVVELLRQSAMMLSAVVMTGTPAASVSPTAPPGGDGMRSLFRSTAFYVASATTNEHGDATVHARLPDNLTTYRVMAVAMSAGDRFGSGQSTLLVTRPLVARPTLPRFVRPGDSLVAGAAVNARDGQPRGVAVQAAADGLRLQGDARRNIVLERRRGGEARFSFHAPPRDSAPDSVTVRLHASDGTNADAVQMRLPMRPDFHPRAHVAIGVVRDSASVIIPLPSDIDAERSRVSLRLGTSPLPAMLAAYDWVRVYPYDCTEQITSAGRILLAVWKTTRNQNPTALGGDPRPRLQELVEELSRRQRPDGGIRYWYDHEWTSPWLSAYVGLFLLDARDAGIAVDSATIVRLARYLHQFSDSPIDSGGMNRYERSKRRLALGDRVATIEYLRRADLPDENAEDALLKVAFLMTWEDRLRLAEALSARADTRAAAASLVDAAWRAVTPAGLRVDLPDSVYGPREFPSRVAPVARLLTATLAARPEQPRLGGLIESVLQLGRAEGRWAWSTQDYASMVLALSALPRDDGSARRIIVHARNGDVLARRVGDVDSMTAVPLSGLLERGPGGRVQLRLRLTADMARQGAGTYFAINVNEVPSKAPVTPDMNGMVVERWYERFDNGQPVTAVTAGDLVRVRLRVTVPADRAFVALEDPLPAGLEPIDLSLRTSGTLAPFVTPASEQARMVGDRDRDGPRWQSWLYGSWEDGWWTPWEHKAIDDDKVIYFARMLWTGSYTASYIARATTSGTFVRPPAHAEEMYNPAVHGRSDGGRFDVSERQP